MQPAPSYYPQQQLDGDWAVYEDGGRLARAADGRELSGLESLGDARNHIRDLEAQIAIDLTLSEIEASIAALIREAA